MARRRKNGKKPHRYEAKKYRLRELIPRIGFDLADKRCRAILSNVDSVIIKEHIRSFAGDLNKIIVDHALAAIFEPAIAAINEDPDGISEMMPGEYWGVIKQAVPWTSDAIPGHTIFSLVVALVVSHEKYDSVFPYAMFEHKYGKLAQAVHEFSGLLKQHYHDNPLVMSFYFDGSISLNSDDEDDEEDEETEVEDEGTEMEHKIMETELENMEADYWAPTSYEAEDIEMVSDEDGDVEMVGYGDENEEEGERKEQELAGGVKAMDLQQTSWNGTPEEV